MEPIEKDGESFTKAQMDERKRKRDEQDPKKKGIKPCTRCGQAHGAATNRRHCEDGVYSLMWGEIPVGDPLTKINGLFVKSQVFK
jgi:hypothetical protein